MATDYDAPYKKQQRDLRARAKASRLFYRSAHGVPFCYDVDTLGATARKKAIDFGVNSGLRK